MMMMMMMMMMMIIIIIIIIITDLSYLPLRTQYLRNVTPRSFVISHINQPFG